MWLMVRKILIKLSSTGATAIPHIMSLAAAARLPYCHNNRAMWDQKIGIFECVDLIPAKWTLHNRPAGTIEAPP